MAEDHEVVPRVGMRFLLSGHFYNVRMSVKDGVWLCEDEASGLLHRVSFGDMVDGKRYKAFTFLGFMPNHAKTKQSKPSGKTRITK